MLQDDIGENCIEIMPYFGLILIFCHWVVYFCFIEIEDVLIQHSIVDVLESIVSVKLP